MGKRLVIAVDGHDGAGKTTLAVALASHLGGRAVRPFSGSNGTDLLAAGERKDVAKLVEVGHTAIDKALASIPGDSPVVFDRAWMTVASFVPESKEFLSLWANWIPTALCWAPLDTTLSRLAKRIDEPQEPQDWHDHYLKVYLKLAKCSRTPVIRTDLGDIKTCLDLLVDWATNSPRMVRPDILFNE